MCIDRATKYQGVDGPDENGDRQDGISLENRQECENADGELALLERDETKDCIGHATGIARLRCPRRYKAHNLG